VEVTTHTVLHKRTDDEDNASEEVRQDSVPTNCDTKSNHCDERGWDQLSLVSPNDIIYREALDTEDPEEDSQDFEAASQSQRSNCLFSGDRRDKDIDMLLDMFLEDWEDLDSDCEESTASLDTPSAAESKELPSLSLAEEGASILSQEGISWYTELFEV
jgi:hypothetical protein